MNDKNQINKNLVRFQMLSWVATILIFGTVMVLFLIDSPIAEKLARGGIIFVLLATLLKLVIMAQQFQSIKQNRLVIFCYSLILLLLSTILIRYFL